MKGVDKVWGLFGEWGKMAPGPRATKKWPIFKIFVTGWDNLNFEGNS